MAYGESFDDKLGKSNREKHKQAFYFRGLGAGLKVSDFLTDVSNWPVNVICKFLVPFELQNENLLQRAHP